MLAVVVTREAVGHAVELTRAFACADHAEAERRKHALRFECARKVRALAHLSEDGGVEPLLRGVQSLLLADDGERPHEADAGGEERAQLAAEIGQLAAFEGLSPTAEAFRGALQVKSLPEQLRVERIVVLGLRRAAHRLALHVFRCVTV